MSTETVILIVDDSSTMRQLLKFSIKRVGQMKVIEANNGEEALAVLAREKVHLVMTDVNMPVMDGLTLIDRIRKVPELASVPIIVITTEADAKDRESALKRGATDYLSKPVQGSAVAAALKKLLPAS